MKQVFLTGLHLAGAFGALRHLRRHSAVVLCYHGVLPGNDDSYDLMNANFVAATAFERHLRWVARRYQLVPLRVIVDALKSGTNFPTRAATITFDDGFANNYRVAFPILRRLGVGATVFLTTDKIGVPGAQLWTERVKLAILLTPLTAVTLKLREEQVYRLDRLRDRENATRLVLGAMKLAPVAQRDEWLNAIEQVCGRPALSPSDAMRCDFLTWDEIREMAAAGIEFGSHTKSHPILKSLDDAQLFEELSGSKRTIERELGTECYAFAYPNGKFADFGAREVRALEAVGYTCALTLEGGLVERDSHRFALNRVNVGRQYPPSLLNASLTGARADIRSLLGRRPAAPVGT